MGIPSVRPDGHFLFVQFAISPLQHRAELAKIGLNLVEILRRYLRPIVFQRSPELFPKLPELFLIHQCSLVRIWIFQRFLRDSTGVIRTTAVEAAETG